MLARHFIFQFLTSGIRKKEIINNGGRGGIRTHGTVTRTSDFESDAFNHSATLPTAYNEGLNDFLKFAI